MFPWVTLGFVGVLGVCFALQHVHTDFLAEAFDEIRLLRMGANAPDLVEVGEWFRLITANFLHRDLRHLSLNVAVILLLGSTLEPILGRKRLFLLIVLTSLAGTIGSLLVTRPALSIGASTAAFGLAGAVAFLWSVRWDELPRGSWLAGAVAVFLVVAEVFEFRAPANVDRGAHRAALVAGFALSLFFTMWKHVSELRESRPRWLDLATGLAVIGVVVAIADGVRAYSSEVDRSVQIWAEARLRRRDVNAFEINNRAQLLASARNPRLEGLELARLRMSQVSRSYPYLHPFWDTLANLDYRLGELSLAIANERNALALVRGGVLRGAAGRDAQPLYAENLARMAEKHLECCGVLRLGRASRFEPRFSIEPAGPDESGEKALVLDLGEGYPQSATIQGLLFRGERPVGYVEVELARAVSPQYRFTKAGSAHNSYPDDIRFEVVLIDSQPAPRRTNLIRLWTFRTDRPLMNGLEPLR